jgi:cupin superfamily acireductone dioxygenase involved in methionine salvage
MEKELKIIEVELKESKEGRAYHRFKTSEGWMSCFEKDVVDDLKQAIGGYALVEVAERGNFKNIVKIVPRDPRYSEESENYKATHKEHPQVTKARALIDDKPSFYVSYAKDVFIALCNRKWSDDPKLDNTKEMMQEAIDLIKQARKAFSQDGD